MDDLEKCRALETEIDRLKNENLRINNHKEEEKLEVAEIEIRQDTQIRARKDLEENITKYNKLTDLSKRAYRKLETQKKQHQDQILEY